MTYMGPFDQPPSGGVPDLNLEQAIANNQAYKGPELPWVQTEFPRSNIFWRHVLEFTARVDGDWGAMPNRTDLDVEQFYVRSGFGSVNPFHWAPTNPKMWQLVRKPSTVADAIGLITALAALPGSPSVAGIVPLCISHSHWKGVDGGATDALLLCNYGSGGGAALIPVETIIGPSNKDAYAKWLLDIQRQLGHPSDDQPRYNVPVTGPAPVNMPTRA